MRPSRRRFVRLRALAFFVVLGAIFGAAPPQVRAQTPGASEAAGSRPVSGRDRDLLVRARKLNEDALDLWRDDPEGALPKAEKAREILREVLGNESPEYADSLDNVARISKLLGQYPRARNLYEEALSIRRRVLGVKHPDYRRSLKNLAGLYYLMEEYEQAEAFFAEASAIETKLAILDDVGEPAGLMAVRSLADIENALGELSGLAGAAAAPPGLLELLKEATGDLEGLDRTRPLGVTLPVLGDTRMLGIVCSIPYSDREKITAIVMRFFPVINEQKGLLLLQGGPFPAYGRADEAESVFLVSTIPELLDSPRARLPGDLFSGEDGPSAVLRVDVAVAMSLRSSPLGQLQAVLLDRVQRLAADLGMTGSSYDEELFHRSLLEPMRQVVGRFLGDTTTAEVTVRTSGEWTCGVEMKVRQDSKTGQFLAAQDERRLRLPELGSPARLAGLQGGIRVTAGLRTAIDHLLVSVRDWLVSNPPPMADRSPAAQLAHRRAALKALSMIEELFREETIEAGWEWIATDKRPQLVFWLRGARCAHDVLELAELVKRARIPRGESELTLSCDQHGRTSIHRIRTGRGAGGEIERLFVAAEERFVVFCAGSSVEPLKRALDRAREQGPLPPAPHRAWLAVDLSLAALARSLLGEISSGEQPVAAAFFENVRGGGDTPIVLTAQPGTDRLVLRCTLPESVLRAVGAALRAALAPSRAGK